MIARPDHSILKKRQELYRRFTHPDRKDLELVLGATAAGMALSGKRFGRRLFLLGSGVGLAAYGCDKSPAGPDPDTTRRVTVINEDILTGSEIGGAVILNGIRGYSGDTFEVDSGIINSMGIDEITTHWKGYLIGIENGKTIYTKDRAGAHGTTVNSDTTIHLRAIPQYMEMPLFGKSIGNHVIPGSDLKGDGTVQHYNKSSVPLGIMNAGLPYTQNTKNTLGKVRTFINSGAGGIVSLGGIQEVTSMLSNGLTHIVRDKNPKHDETVSGNVITDSWAGTRPNTSYLTIAAEVLQAFGIRNDGGFTRVAYLTGSAENPQWDNNGSEALRILYILPPGFLVNTNQNLNASAAWTQTLEEVIIENQHDTGMFGGPRYTPNPHGVYGGRIGNRDHHVERTPAKKR